MAWLYLIGCFIGAAWTTTALIRLNNKAGPVIIPYFFLSLMASEMPLHFIAVQLLLTLFFALFGVFEVWQGSWGLAISFASWAGLGVVFVLANENKKVLIKSLDDALGEEFRLEIPDDRRETFRPSIAPREWLLPFAMKRPGVKRIADLAYSDEHERHTLDIYLPDPAPAPDTPCPVLLQVHGGAWVVGHKQQQAMPLVMHLAQRGWACVAINYRLSPNARFPDHVIDVKRAIAWLHENGNTYGLDTDFIAITGGSAGGHLSSLTALTGNKAVLQPGFENADTSISAAVPFYGIYDFLDRGEGRYGPGMIDFLTQSVMPSSPGDDRALWELVSPISQVSEDAPPFFVIHGTHDVLAPVEGAQDFVDELRQSSNAPAAYAELPWAQHAYEVVHSIRTEHTVDAVHAFLEWALANHRKKSDVSSDDVTSSS